MMKKTVLLAILIPAVAAGLILTTSCKRANVEDPPMNPPSGFRISLSGQANPSTLYVPTSGSPSVSNVTVYVKDNQGVDVNTGSIIFQYGGYGYLDNYETTVKKDVIGGIASVKYKVPTGTYIKTDTDVLVKATYVDSGSLDSSGAEVFDYITLKLIPAEPQNYITVSGRVMSSVGSKGIEGVVVLLSTGEVALTNESGAYSMYASLGWLGSIKPEKEGYSFIPTSIEHETAWYTDLTGQDFYADVRPSIEVDYDTFDLGSDLTTVKVYVYSDPDPQGVISFIAATGNVSWVRVSRDATNWASEISGRTPQFIWIQVAANGSTETRNTDVVITAIDPDNVDNSPLSIAISQDGI